MSDCARLALLGLFVATIPSAAAAELELLPVAIVPVVAGGDLKKSEVEAAVRESLAWRPLRALTEEEIFAAGGLEDPACTADIECLARSLAPTRARLAIIAVANLIPDPPLVAVRLFDLETKKPMASRAELLPAGELLVAALGRHTREALDEGGFGRLSRIRVAVSAARVVLHPSSAAEPSAAEPSSSKVPESEDIVAAVDGESSFWVRPGRWEIRASGEGREPRFKNVDALPGVESFVEIELEREDPWWSSTPLWVAVAAGVVGAGVVALIVVDRKSCICLHPTECPPC